MFDGFTIDDVKWLISDRKKLLKEKALELRKTTDKKVKKQLKIAIKYLKKQIRAYRLYVLENTLGL
jgi:hypothetical protein